MWHDELRRGLVSCGSSWGMSRCCLRNQSGSVAGALMTSSFLAGHREEVVKIGALLKERWETRDQLIGPGSGDQKELHSLSRTLRWCRDGL